MQFNMKDLIGTQFAGYVMEAIIDLGNASCVFTAHQPLLPDKQVAIRILFPPATATEEEERNVLATFQREL